MRSTAERARRCKIAHDPTYITLETILALLSARDTCPICDVVFEVRPKGFRKANVPAIHSIDRIDPRKGYIRGNVAIICWGCNALKSDATASELRRIADWMDGFDG